MVKAGHILKCNAARDFTSWSTAAWGRRRLLLALSTTASNFFPPHPPCIIGMRYADVPGETLVLAKFGSEPKCTCTVKVQENPPSLGWIQRWNGCDWGSRDQGSGFTFWRFRFWSSSQSSRIRIKDQRSGQESINKDQGFRGRIEDQSFLYEYKIRSSLDFNLSWAPGE